eukprot:gnl/TRDRNA2_/TRDRNA2_164575_c2_seq3.p3 gnl/TRDRNA2_/TRDRNA2_164575_c2~~gnl/TRDRNA2_/TRDRNA2_164575_c2_seq3.p3  ORF type:complete len:126 (+),score=24.12 gnl/TRDRNA2_/TRDRNA2_164575_c2_seq3:48-425(+)
MMLDSRGALAESLLQRAGPGSRHGVLLLSLVIVGLFLSRQCLPFQDEAAVAMSDTALTEKAPAVVKKIDPENGMVYSFEELAIRYAENKTDDEIKKYWEDECKKAKKAEWDAYGSARSSQDRSCR